eukprot:TRINITY_DN3873_c0_g2_i1.p1 TRINITY_DN3873_c0_g2~~TRINITY_DN3873_c0_g2_i1.p1  ORF type:complete len:260 (+),score=42.86 TRINITY_DN3873_c0_g2_i1:26-805(+)
MGAGELPQEGDRFRWQDLELNGESLRVLVDEELGVAGRPWPAQQVAADVTNALLKQWQLSLGAKGEASNRLSLVELGSGCGALACSFARQLGPQVRVLATDLPEVVELMQANAAANKADVESHSLPWGDDAALSALNVQNGPLLVIACECAYWGGWDIFSEDTRGPLADTVASLLLQANRDEKGMTEGGGSCCAGVLVFQVRDASRELAILPMLQERGLQVVQVDLTSGVPKAEPVLPNEGEVGAWLLGHPGTAFSGLQ